MAAGLPSIGTRVGGIMDIISDGENGLLCEPNDIKSLARYIEEVHINDDLRAKLITEGLKTAQKYSWKLITNQLIMEYEKILER